MSHDAHPPFEAPWQAQAFALAVHLHEQGLFTWNDWSRTLGAERQQSASAGAPDTAEQYYLDWLRALERMLADRGAAHEDECARFRAAWVAAYEATPHGRPVDLDTGFAALGERPSSA